MKFVRCCRSPGPRAAFTLVEILVVVSILTILMALATAGAAQFIRVQKQKNTESLIQTLGTTLDKHWKEVVKKANEEPIPSGVLTLAGNDPRRARVIWIKLRLKQEFPMNFTEALQPDGGLLGTPSPLPPRPSYATALAGVTPNPKVQPYESSVCLLLALSQSRGGIKQGPEELAGASALVTSPVNGLKMFVDAWGNPLAFYRWPTANLELNPLNPPPANSQAQNGFVDSGDPEGLLSAKVPNAWPDTNMPTNRKQFENLCHDLAPAGQAKSFRTDWIIVSTGADRLLGIPPAKAGKPDPMDTTGNLPESFDNIYSNHLLRLGARGD